MQMRDHTVALAQIAPRLGRPADNLRAHLDRIDEAISRGADRIVFPELSLTGYHLLDQAPEVAVRLDDPFWTPLFERSRRIEIVVGFVEESPDLRFYNSAALLVGGRLSHVHRKVYLPTYGMFQEGRDFAAGNGLRAFDTPLGRAGLLICEDLWHPVAAWLMAQDGADVLIGPSNSPTRGARDGQGVTSLHVWRHLLQVSAQFQTCYVVYVNRVGAEDGLIFGGGSFAVDPFGRVLAEAPALDETLLLVPLEASVLRRARIAYPLLRDERLELAARELNRVIDRRARPAALEADGQRQEDLALPADPASSRDDGR